MKKSNFYLFMLPANFVSIGFHLSVLLILLIISSIMTIARGDAPMELVLTSPAFNHQGEIPVGYTCDGEDISPELSWSYIPTGTKSLALIMEDPDAPDPAAPKMTWIHWMLYNIPLSATGLRRDINPVYLPIGTREGLNSWGRTGYGGPCPPIGRHRYFISFMP